MPTIKLISLRFNLGASSKLISASLRHPTATQGFEGIKLKLGLLEITVTSCVLPSVFFISYAKGNPPVLAPMTTILAIIITPYIN